MIWIFVTLSAGSLVNLRKNIDIKILILLDNTAFYYFTEHSS